MIPSLILIHPMELCLTPRRAKTKDSGTLASLTTSTSMATANSHGPTAIRTRVNSTMFGIVSKEYSNNYCRLAGFEARPWPVHTQGRRCVRRRIRQRHFLRPRLAIRSISMSADALLQVCLCGQRPRATKATGRMGLEACPQNIANCASFYSRTRNYRVNDEIFPFSERSGRGRLFSADVLVYDGDWEHDERCGHGTGTHDPP